MRTIRFLIVMGVSGSGKTSVGKTLGEHFGWDFYDTMISIHLKVLPK